MVNPWLVNVLVGELRSHAMGQLSPCEANTEATSHSNTAWMFQWRSYVLELRPDRTEMYTQIYIFNVNKYLYINKILVAKRPQNTMLLEHLKSTFTIHNVQVNIEITMPFSWKIKRSPLLISKENEKMNLSRISYIIQSNLAVVVGNIKILFSYWLKVYSTLKMLIFFF